MKENQSPTHQHRARIIVITMGVVLLCLVSTITMIWLTRPRLSAKAESLMDKVKPQMQSSATLTEDFRQIMANFSIRTARTMQTDTNALISPPSLYLALAMTANGAVGETKAQFDTLLSNNLLTDIQRNEQCAAFSKLFTISNKKRTPHIANSIWYNDPDIQVEPSFLQTNADYFDADAFRADFNQPQTVKDINNWVKSQTNGMIPKLVDSKKDFIHDNAITLLSLINTVLFEMPWETRFPEYTIKEDVFHAARGDVEIDFLHSTESTYLQGEHVTGFAKSYEGDSFRFVGLLPEDGTTPEQLLADLTGERWLSLMKGTDGAAKVSMPRFSYESKLEWVEPLQAMGLVDAFDGKKANFTKMGNTSMGNLYIKDVLQKTVIELNENGTKAAAATKVDMGASGAPLEVHDVNLNRPFVYAIVHRETGLPLFLGVLRNPAGA